MIGFRATSRAAALRRAMRAIPRIAVAASLALAAGMAAAAEFKRWNGAAAPALALRELDGPLHRLDEYRGRVVLLNFWATWCGPCRDEMPSIERLRGKLAGRPFSVLAVNLDEPESRIRRFLSGMKVKFTVLLDPGRAASRAWDARILPATYIIGADGRIRYHVVGELDWDNEHVVARIVELLPPGDRGSRSAR